MPTAPLIRLNVVIHDRPEDPFKFESFLNVADESQAKVLDELANQDELFLSFYGDDLKYRYTKIVEHDEQQWQLLDELVEQAVKYWATIPSDKRDFDRAKAEFIRQYV